MLLYRLKVKHVRFVACLNALPPTQTWLWRFSWASISIFVLLSISHARLFSTEPHMKKKKNDAQHDPGGKLEGHVFLKGMINDDYFPNELVKEGQEILRELCRKFDLEPPASLEELLKHCHAATELFNELDEKFQAQDSEIETMARDTIAEDFYAVAKAYGFPEADMEDLVEPRDW